MVARFLSFLIIFALMAFFKLIAGVYPFDPALESAVVLGFLILTGYNIGELVKLIKLPRITGYLLTGLIFSPRLLGFITPASIVQLRLIDHIALSLIAFSAGRELKLSILKRRFKSILSITLFAVIFCFCGMFLFVYLGADKLFPFLQGLPRREILVFALLFGVLSLAKSPVTTIAILEESEAEGPFSETVLGSVILKDIIVLVLFAVALNITKGLMQGGTAEVSFIGTVLWQLFGSIAIGVVLGYVFSLYIRFVKRRLVFFLISAAFLCTLVATKLHLEVLILSMASAFFIENFTDGGEHFLSAIKKGSALVYIIFFTISGAGVNLAVVREVWFIAFIMICVRELLTWAGIYTGSRIVEDFPALRRYAWMGFINQAGLTLVIAKVISETFPAFGQEFLGIAIGLIIITDYVGPPLFKLALVKAGEAGKA